MNSEAAVVELAWQGPFVWFGSGSGSVFDDPSAEVPGVYLWTVPIGDTYRVFYVGQTEKGFAERHHEHFREYWGGAYSIYDAKSFVGGKLVPVYEGYAYKKPRWRQARSFHTAFLELVQPLLEHLKPMKLWVAENRCPARIQRRIESALIGILYARAHGAGSLLQPGLQRQSRRAEEQPICVIQRPSGLIEGLPEEFAA